MGAGLTYPSPLVEGTFLARRQRFFADVRLDDGTEVVAHCANTGSMRGLEPPARCRVAHVPAPGRKLAWTLEQVAVGDGGWAVVNTARPNRVVEAAIRAGALPTLAGFPHLRREVPFGERSRVDLLLHDDHDRRVFVEVKNVTLVRDGVAAFPDAVSARGARHLDELAAVVAGGDRAVLVLHVGRTDAHVFEPADDLDPAWGAALRRAVDAGVEVLPVVARADAEGIRVVGALPWRIPTPSLRNR